jgi:oxygen-dependent protoporphyrinogen oxidase
VTLGDGRPVTIVGGGISGLSAALHLHDHGHPVRVLEAEDRPGGKLRTSPLAGRPVDEAADAFLIRRPEALALCRRLGLDAQLVHPAARSAAVFADGALRPLPPQLMGVPTDLDATAASGLLDEAGLARLRQDLDQPSGALTGADTTVAAEVERRLGRQALDRLVGPLVGGINAGDPERLSLASVVPQLDAAARDREHPSLIEACRAQIARARSAGADPAAPIFAAHPAGMAALVEALEHALPEGTIQTGHPVEALADLLPDRAAVLAIPAPAVAELLRPQPAARTARAHLAAVEHASVVMVALAVDPQDLDGSITPESSGFLVPRDQDTLITACTAASQKWAHLAADAPGADGTVILRASAGRHGDQRALDLDDPDLLERVLRDLARTAGLRGQPKLVRITRWIDSFPQYAPGHADRMDEVRADLRTNAPGVGVCGMALRGVGIPACIGAALEAAEQAVAS